MATVKKKKKARTVKKAKTAKKKARRTLSIPSTAHNRETKTTFFVPAFFKARREGRQVIYRKGIKKGAKITKGKTIIADIFWSTGKIEPIFAKATGTIFKRNGKIKNADLGRPPPQFVIVLS